MEVAFLLLRLPTGILDFTIAVTIVSLMFGGFVQPILVAAGVESNLGSWRIDTFGESLVWMPISILFLLVGPRLLVGWGGISGVVRDGDARGRGTRGAEACGRRRAGASRSSGCLRDHGSAPAALGRGPFLSATRLEATLLALESNGVVTSRRDGPRTTYALA